MIGEASEWYYRRQGWIQGGKVNWTVGPREGGLGRDKPLLVSLRERGFSRGEGESKHPLPLSGVLHTFSPRKKYAVGDRPRSGERNTPIIRATQS